MATPEGTASYSAGVKTPIIHLGLIILLASCDALENSPRSTYEGFCSKLSKGYWEDALYTFSGQATVAQLSAPANKIMEYQRKMIQNSSCKINEITDNEIIVIVNRPKGSYLVGESKKAYSKVEDLAFLTGMAGGDIGNLQNLSMEFVAEAMANAITPDAPHEDVELRLRYDKTPTAWEVSAHENNRLFNFLMGTGEK